MYTLKNLQKIIVCVGGSLYRYSLYTDKKNESNTEKIFVGNQYLIRKRS